MKLKTPFLTRFTYGAAIALALFSGGVSTYGLTKFAPGAEVVIAAMGLLFEAGKLTAFALVHKRMPCKLKSGLLFVGLVLMTLNIVGVSGFLSNAYEHEQTAARASSHTAESEAGAGVELLERQLTAVERSVSEATAAVTKAKGDRDQIKAANALLTAAKAERDALVQKLAAAQTKKARAEGQTITATGEFAAIAFIAAATGATQETVAHIVILVTASLPDVLAVLLLVAAGYTQAAPAVEAVPALVKTEAPKRTARQIAARKGWATRRRNAAKVHTLKAA